MNKEDEFILISKLLGKCSSIQKVDQSKYITKNNLIPPDLLATYTKDLDTSIEDQENQITLFIEVKKVHKKYWKISNKDFDRRVRYADLNGIQLFFAINFTFANLNLWTLFPANFIKQNNFRISIEQWGNNLFDYLVGNLTIHFKDFDLTKIYSKSAKSIFKHPEYGCIEKSIISTDGKQFEFHGDDPINLLFRALNSTETISNEKNIRKRHYNSQITTLYQLLIGCIKVVYGDEDDFNIGKYLKNIVENEDEIINLDFGHYMISKMEEIGIAIAFTMDPNIFE